jgi:ferredoxin
MEMIQTLQDLARDLLTKGKVASVIGYEVGPRGRTRPAFIYNPEDVSRLTWNQAATHNLTTYLHDKVQKPEDRVAVVVKPCDSRAIHVLLSDNKIDREQVYIIGMACEGIQEGAGFSRTSGEGLQARCQTCTERTPVVYDTLIGEPPEVKGVTDVGPYEKDLERLEGLSPEERAEFWLRQFDRCIRCYACRQACPMCDCPTCLYERDDSLWIGMGTGLSEKRAFHLGRAYHLAGRCVGCDECERVCPMDIPISLLNRKLAKEIQEMFDYQAGLEPIPSPITTILSGEEVGT